MAYDALNDSPDRQDANAGLTMARTALDKASAKALPAVRVKTRTSAVPGHGLAAFALPGMFCYFPALPCSIR